MHASQDGAPFGFAASAHSRSSWASCCRVWPARGLVGTAGTTVHAATARTATITRNERMSLADLGSSLHLLPTLYPIHGRLAHCEVFDPCAFLAGRSRPLPRRHHSLLAIARV